MGKDKFFTADQIKPGSQWKSRMGKLVTVQEVKNGIVSYACKQDVKWSSDYFNFQCKYIPTLE